MNEQAGRTAAASMGAQKSDHAPPKQKKGATIAMGVAVVVVATAACAHWKQDVFRRLMGPPAVAMAQSNSDVPDGPAFDYGPLDRGLKEHVHLDDSLKLATPTPDATQDEAGLDLCWMAGQSNMQGWTGNAAMYPRDLAQLDQRIRFYWVTPGHSSSDERWTTMRPQAGRYPKGHFGPEVTFARLLLGKGFRPAIFKFSLGGTKLAKDWGTPGHGGLCDQMIQQYRKAVDRLKEQGFEIKLRAFVWIQGESDAENIADAIAYDQNLSDLVRNIRSVAGDPHLPVLLGVDEQYPARHLDAVLEAHKSLAKQDPHITFTSMIGLEKSDASHLTPRGLEKHGQRLFEGFLAILNTTRGTGP